MNDQGPIIYAVRAELPAEAARNEYIQWLSDGHVQAVLAGGAESCEIAALDRSEAASPPEPWAVEVRYLFRDRRALERYLRELAPALRQEGLARFGPQRPDGGARFSRTTAVCTHRLPNG